MAIFKEFFFSSCSALAETEDADGKEVWSKGVASCLGDDELARGVCGLWKWRTDRLISNTLGELRRLKRWNREAPSHPVLYPEWVHPWDQPPSRIKDKMRQLSSQASPNRPKKIKLLKAKTQTSDLKHV